MKLSAAATHRDSRRAKETFMPVNIPAGKLRKLKMLADPNGRFKMLAIDQRGSVAAALAKVAGVDPKEISYDAMARTKAAITRALSPRATALLTDPIFGFPYSGHTVPGDVAVLLAYEDTGYEKAGPNRDERISRKIPGWSVTKAKRAGADAIKFLLYYHPDASAETRRFQENLIRGIGEECAAEELPLLLELVAYPVGGVSADSREYALQKPDLVIRSAEEFSKPEYGVDILKMEFPCNLKFAEEYAPGFFDGKAREAAYSLAEVANHCKRLDAACGVPWVILSAGVDIEEFLENIKFANEAGASGFLCGRAIWKGALDRYPDDAAMEAYCRSEGVYNFVRCNAFAEKSLPWFDHRKFGGWENIRIEGLSPDWYAR
jgi:tagatose 1,6-diphosphate aldolase